MTWTFDSKAQEQAYRVMSEYMFLWVAVYRHETGRELNNDRLYALWNRYRKDRPHVKDWREVE